METNNRECKRCKGTGTIHHKGFQSLEGKVYPDRDEKCQYCVEGFYPPIDEQAILSAIVATKGKNKGRIRAAMTSVAGYEIAESRAYYVWRLARFHGGKDMTMPMTADLGVRNDPFKPELDKLADECAKVFFGTDTAAAYRWGRAFGLL